MTVKVPHPSIVNSLNENPKVNCPSQTTICRETHLQVAAALRSDLMGSFTSSLLNGLENHQTTSTTVTSTTTATTTATTNMISSLPEDLLMQILVRLPIKTLLHCRCISKSWYSLLNSPTFITLHINHNIIHTSNNVIIIQRWNETSGNFRFTLHKDNETLDWIRELDQPIPGTNHFYKILDCISGLVCLLDDSKVKDNLVLWNPLIKKVLILPNPTIEGDFSVESSCFGFGFDPLASDFKVVRIVYDGVGSLVEVFRLKTRSWRRIDVSSSRSLPTIVSYQAYVNGNVNWVTRNHMILAFEVGNEEFKEIMLPKGLDKVNVLELTAAVWKGFLSVFAFENCGCLIYGRIPAGRVSLWVMREYGAVESWSAQFVIEPYAIYRQVRGIRMNGYIIFEDLYGRLISSDPEPKRIEHLKLLLPGTLSAFHMKSYGESLVLLDSVENNLCSQKAQVPSN